MICMTKLTWLSLLLAWLQTVWKINCPGQFETLLLHMVPESPNRASTTSVTVTPSTNTVEQPMSSAASQELAQEKQSSLCPVFQLKPPGTLTTKHQIHPSHGTATSVLPQPATRTQPGQFGRRYWSRVKSSREVLQKFIVKAMQWPGVMDKRDTLSKCHHITATKYY